MRRCLVGAGVALALALVAAPAAGAATPKTETATSGPVAATLTYTRENDYVAKDVRLAITRAGAPATVGRGGDVAAGCRQCPGAMPIGGLPESQASSLTLADLTGDGDPEVIVDLYTGGAHCCSISAIYGWDPATSSYRRTIGFWGDPGSSLTTLRGEPGQAIVTADFRFAYAFCAYACSAMPEQVFRYQDFRLVDVTRQHPDRIRADLAGLQRMLRRAARSREARFAVPGVLPAICANLYLLDRGAQCRRQLRTALRRGWLGTSAKGDVWPAGRRYAPAVLRALRTWGYR